jgi:hypothetical protein
VWKLNNDSEWFEDHEIAHVTQGDVYADIPVQYVGFSASGRFRSSGQSKKPGLIGDAGLAVVLDYTCRIVSQPPGKVGYAHPFRRLAPVRPLADMISKKSGITANNARKIAASNGITGLSYVPLRPEWGLITDGEFGHCGVVLLYAAITVHQEVLDSSPRVGRLSEPAQRILAAKTMEMFGPMPVDPWQDEMAVDRSDSWASGVDSA